MSPSKLFEPTYNAIKSRLMQGAWSPGERLEVARLGSELGVSITPVRDSLNRLVGEQMIDALAGLGFRVPAFQEQGLADIYHLNSFLLRGALLARAGEWDVLHDGSVDYASRCAHVFLHIAKRSGNAEIMKVIRNLNDRLHWLRGLEVMLFETSESEVAAIRQAIDSQFAPTEVDALIEAYHARRVQGIGRFLHVLSSRK